MCKKNLIILCMLIVCGVTNMNAQIGYQVSLLNSATGEPRANETVSVTLEITNSEGAVVCQESTSATTNEFGVLSLSVGSSNTFANMDWSKLPLYISATVDGVMVGRSQILTVPVAEAAKTLVNVDPELICKTWSGSLIISSETTLSYSITLSNSGGFTWVAGGFGGSGKYACYGNIIYFYTNVTGISPAEPPLSALYQNGTLYLSTEGGGLVMH